MKRIISLLLVLTLIFTLAACSNKTDVSSDQAFQRPENYSTILVLTINPQFRLYLDDQDKVLAVEPVNDDAKTVVKDIEFDDDLENVIEKIVSKSNESGFVKENATIDLKIAETKKELGKAETILNTAKVTVTQTVAEINVTVDIKTSVEENVSTEQTDVSSTEIATTSEPAHTHTFADATCTKPKTCSCGVTEGTPLAHNYKDGKCTACGASDPNYKPTSLSAKNGDWTAEYIYNETYYSARITLVGDSSIGVGAGDPISKMEQEVQDDIRKHKDEEGYKDSYLVFEGTEFWCARGSFTPLNAMVESVDTITLTSSEEPDAQIVLTRTDENTLTVKSCTQTLMDMLFDIPVGTKFTFVAY